MKLDDKNDEETVDFSSRDTPGRRRIRRGSGVPAHAVGRGRLKGVHYV